MPQDFNLMPQIADNLKYLNDHAVEIGVMGGGEIQMRAFVNEYGMDIDVTDKMRKYLHSVGLHLKADTKKIHIPERSFFNSTLEDKKAVGRAIDRITPAISGDITGKMALDRMGETLASEMGDKIKSNIAPSNHPFTVSRKKSRKTLADTGDLARAITHEVK
jgi:phage gpG-like protein